MSVCAGCAKGERVQEIQDQLKKVAQKYKSNRRQVFIFSALTVVMASIQLALSFHAPHAFTLIVLLWAAAYCCGQAVAAWIFCKKVDNHPTIGYMVALHNLFANVPPEKARKAQLEAQLYSSQWGAPGFAPPQHSEFFEDARTGT